MPLKAVGNGSRYALLGLVAGSLLTIGSGRAWAECVPGMLTTLARLSCANAWPADDAKFKWPDLAARCDPKSDPLCDSARARISLPLRSDECGKLQVLDVLPDDRLARVRCERSAAASSELLINLDSLSCHARNVTTYAPAKHAAQGGIPPAEARVLVERAEAKMREMVVSIAADTRLLRRLVASSGAESLQGDLKPAVSFMDGARRKIAQERKLDADCEPLDSELKMSDDAVRAQRTCRLLKAAVLVGEPLQSLPPRSLKIELERRLQAADSYYDEARALAARMLAYQVLAKRSSALHRRLKLIRLAKESGVRGLRELHSGFVFGGSRLEGNSGGGYDCSDFVASLIEGRDQGRESPLSTGALKEAAHELLDGQKGAKQNDKDGGLSGCFVAIDLRAGAVPQPGDLVVSNNGALKDGHVAIVKKVLKGDSVLTIEATGGGANTIMSKARPLREPVPECGLQARNHAQATPYRPDLYVLRLRAAAKPDCPLRLDGLAEPGRA